MASMGGGGLLCANGILAALFSLARSPTARGLVVESNLVSGTRYFSSIALLYALLPDNPFFSQPPGQGIADGGAPFYNSYQCADEKWISVACFEPQFYKIFCKLIEENVGPKFSALPNTVRPGANEQNNRNQWVAVARWLEAAFKTRPRHEWNAVFKGSDACVVPVLTPAEAAQVHGSEPAPHPNFIDFRNLGNNGPVSLPRPSDMLPHTPSLLRAGKYTFDILRKIGIDSSGIMELHKQGALGNQLEAHFEAKL